jgi:hypothetical protein
MDLAFTVTPPLSKRFCLPVVLCHATIAAPIGPRSDIRIYSLVIKFLHNFFTPYPSEVDQESKFVAADGLSGGPVVVSKHPGGPM